MGSPSIRRKKPNKSVQATAAALPVLGLLDFRSSWFHSFLWVRRLCLTSIVRRERCAGTEIVSASGVAAQIPGLPWTMTNSGVAAAAPWSPNHAGRANSPRAFRLWCVFVHIVHQWLSRGGCGSPAAFGESISEVEAPNARRRCALYRFGPRILSTTWQMSSISDSSKVRPCSWLMCWKALRIPRDGRQIDTFPARIDSKPPGRGS